MGSKILIAMDADEAPIADMIDQVQHWFEEWEQVLSRFRITSELTHLNQHPGMAIQVSDTLWEVLLLAQKTETETNGLVTPIILNALEAAGYDQSFDKLKDETNRYFLNSMTAPINSGDRLELDHRKHLVTLPFGCRVDLGGFGKGWAANKAMLRLQTYAPTLVDAGGDIAISGPKADSTAWPVGVENPFNPDQDVDLVMISGGGLATSGKDYRRWKREDRWMHHIIDPRTSEPADSDLFSVTVIGRDVMEAEAAAKTALILGSNNAFAWLQNKPGLAFLFILENGEVILSENYKNYQWNESWQTTETKV